MVVLFIQISGQGSNYAIPHNGKTHNNYANSNQIASRLWCEDRAILYCAQRWYNHLWRLEQRARLRNVSRIRRRNKVHRRIPRVRNARWTHVPDDFVGNVPNCTNKFSGGRGRRRPANAEKRLIEYRTMRYSKPRGPSGFVRLVCRAKHGTSGCPHSYQGRWKTTSYKVSIDGTDYRCRKGGNTKGTNGGFYKILQVAKIATTCEQPLDHIGRVEARRAYWGIILPGFWASAAT